MYPKVARPVQNLPGGGGAGGKAGVHRGDTDKKATGGGGGAAAGAAAAAAAAGMAERGMHSADQKKGEIEALRERTSVARKKANEPQDPRSRLQRHLRLRGFAIKDVPGDNNCQFHAIADQLAQVGISGYTALKLRQKTVAWLKANGDRPMDDGKVRPTTTCTPRARAPCASSSSPLAPLAPLAASSCACLPAA